MDFLGLIDPDAVDFLGVGLSLGEVAINASKSPLLSPEGTYVLNPEMELRTATICMKTKEPRAYDVDTHPSRCLYLAVCLSSLFALLSSNVNPLASSLTGSMKNAREESQVLVICAAAMPIPATVVGEGTLSSST
jgi:hypothetical protein